VHLLAGTALALDSACKRTPTYLPALVKLAELSYRNMEYARALQLAKKSAQHPYHGRVSATNLYYKYGHVNDQLGNYNWTPQRRNFEYRKPRSGLA